MSKRERAKNKAFPGLIKYQRELRGWSQARMADELGTTPNRISSWERALSLPSAYFREQLCAHLNMDAEELGLLPIDEQSPSDLAQDEENTSDISKHIDKPLQQHQDHSYSHLRDFLFQRPLVRGTFLVLSIILIGSVLVALLIGMFNPGAANPYPPHRGQMVLNDSLKDQSSGVNWQEGLNDQQANCLFKNGGYVAFQPLIGHFHACVAQKTDYRNFAYEVEMTVQTGDFGGIVFRAEDSIDAHYYLFRVHTDGSYWLYRFANRNIEAATLLDSGSIQAFHKGVGKTNLVAIVAQDNSFTLYVNRQAISSLEDAGYTHGQIGVLAGSLLHGPAEATFKNVKVWTW